MDLLDWSGIVSSYSDDGCPAYPPQVMTKVLAYAYSNGVRSSRKIEALVENDKRYIWLAGGLRPDFHTLARFRRAKWDYLVGLFEDSARVCAESGLVFLNAVSIDGSKVRGKASRKAVYDQKRIDRQRAQIERVLREAEEVDRTEDEEFGSGNGRQLPAGLSNIEERKARLAKASNLLRESKRKRVVVSDADSRVMKTRESTAPCYNLQAAVDSENQIIVGMNVVTNEVDHGLLPEMMQRVEDTVGMSADVCLADTGYCDEQTLLAVESGRRDVLMPPQEPNKEKREAGFQSASFVHDQTRDVLICPAGRELAFRRLRKTDSGTYKVYTARGCRSCPFYERCAGGKKSRIVSRSIVWKMRESMRQRLRTDVGKAQYALRRQTVEPVFGQIKTDMGFERLLLGGLEGAKAEVALVCLAHNVKKCGKRLRDQAVEALWLAGKARIRARFLRLRTILVEWLMTAVPAPRSHCYCASPAHVF
jgi:transposase